MATAPLHPTLWRTCRVLANRQRLRLLKSLHQRPNQCVAEVARQCGMDPAVASQYLRALNARGLLDVARSGRWVRYRPSEEGVDERTTGLLRALRSAFKQEHDPAEKIYRVSTAFTHPRRLEIWRAVQRGSSTAAELRRKLRISPPALGRHLQKLQLRGFLSAANGQYHVVRPREPLAQALAELASMD